MRISEEEEEADQGLHGLHHLGAAGQGTGHLHLATRVRGAMVQVVTD